MSAIARYLKSNGKTISGYDRVKSELCEELENEGIKIYYEDDIEQIKITDSNVQNSLVIYTPAIPNTSKIITYFRQNNFTICKRSQILGLITQNSFNISVAGTHGKTTTSSLIAHLLNVADKQFAAFLGGISVNLNSNYFNTNKSNNKSITVTEADEYDRSFLTLSPDIAIITSMDADHLDIYGTAGELKKTFFDFIEKIKPDGLLIINNKLQSVYTKNIKTETYGLDKGDYHAKNIRIENSRFVFDFKYKNKTWANVILGIPGIHNVENAVSAIAVCLSIGIEKETIIKGLKSFLGVKRRFEYIINNEKTVFIDDYAHHPSEIEALLKSVKILYNDKKTVGVFQPHLYSRTRDFAEDFAKSLSLLDTCILLDIYPARELPIDGVSSELLFEKITSTHKYLCTKENLNSIINQIKPSLLITIGAGDIDTCIPSLKKILINE